VHVVSHKAIRGFGEHFPDARSPLDYWYRVARRATWGSFTEVKQTFSSADFVAPFVVFNIGGNKYRLIAEINFPRRVLFIRCILTHKEYSKGAWKA
jgi:mRNA interferase HigB